MELLFGKGTKAAPMGGAGEAVKEVTTATFVVEVIEASAKTPVIVEFWSPRFPQAKPLSGTLEKLVAATKGGVRLVRVNIDKAPELATQMRLQTVPTVYAFKEGRPVDGFAGSVTDGELKRFVESIAGTTGGGDGVEEALAEAKHFLAEGDPTTAMEIYQEILAQDPANGVALGGTLRSLLALGQADQAKLVLAGLTPELAKHAEVIAARTAIDLAAQASQAGPAAELRRAVATNPADHQARFDLALAYFADGEREAAVDELLEIVRRDRAWNDQAARKQLLKLMEAIGYSDPLSVSTRKRLSSIMFA